MQTFRISKVQEQSYYAIRIFGIVHLLGVIGLAVLLDGPSNGLRGITWVLILGFLSFSVFLLVRVIQAKAGRIHGHYVLTRNTLAIMLLGQPRMFVRRDDCTGMLPGSWKLVLRNGRHLPLGSVSAKPYLKDLVTGVCKVWWPGLHGTPLWAGLMDSNRIGSLDLRVDLRAHPDGRDPLLVYTVGKSHLIWQYLILGTCPLLSFWFFVLLIRSWRKISVDQLSTEAILWCISAAGSLLGIAAALTTMAHIARELYIRRSANHAFVLSGRRIALIREGKSTVYQGADALQAFNGITGRLYFLDGSSMLAAPYSFGAPYDGLLRTLLLRWRLGHGAISSVNKVNSLLLVLMALMWTCMMMDEASGLWCVILICLSTNFWTSIFERTDVSVSVRKKLANTNATCGSSTTVPE